MERKEIIRVSKRSQNKIDMEVLKVVNNKLIRAERASTVREQPRKTQSSR